VQAKIANALPDGFRKCTKCQQIKPATSEYFDYRDAKCGTLHAECKPCKAERWQKHLQENPQYWHNWYQERAEHVKASVREYYQEHTGERIAYRKKYYLEHREECLAKVSIYKRTHRGAYTALQHKRNAMKNGVPGTHTDKDIQDQYKRQKGKCYYCSCKLGKQRGDYTVDHVIPISRGGSNAPSNLVITCPSCNFSKHNKLPHEWPQGGRLM
jgi:5-methylcytosine-specific restriction endonuclease McrA